MVLECCSRQSQIGPHQVTYDVVAWPIHISRAWVVDYIHLYYRNQSLQAPRSCWLPYSQREIRYMSRVLLVAIPNWTSSGNFWYDAVATLSSFKSTSTSLLSLPPGSLLLAHHGSGDGILDGDGRCTGYSWQRRSWRTDGNLGGVNLGEADESRLGEADGGGGTVKEELRA